MFHTIRLFPMSLIVALLLSACQPIVAPAAQSLPAAPTEPHGLRPDAPSYAIQGPYAVGVQDFEIEAANETERPLTVTVWYPAVNSQGLSESITYEMGFPAGDTPNFSVVGNAIEGAEPATATGPYPVIVHAHGHYTFRQESPWLAEHLASQGFVVISADHEDNWSTLFGPKPWQAEFRRPDEVRRELDFAERLTAEGGDLAGVLDMEHAAVTGWSYGANTALVAAGARVNMDSFRIWCEENTVNGEAPDTDCTDILDHEAELATLAGLDTVPEGLWPDWSDERIDAVIALAPWPRLMVPTGLQSVDVATLLMVGSGDTSVGSTYDEIQPYEQIAAAKKSEIVFDGADHLIFFSDCGDAPEVVDLGLHVFCSDPVWDMDRAHDLVNHFATAFLSAELKGDAAAAAALAPENVSFPGIQYEASGYVPAPTEAKMTPPVDDPSSVIMAMTERFNAGDLEGVFDYFADDARVYFFGLPPTGSEVYDGKEQFRPVWEENIASHLLWEAEIDSVVGETVKGRAKTWHDFTRELGVAPLEANEIWAIRDGKIAFYAWAATEESAARLKAALAEAMPAEPAEEPALEPPVSALTVTFVDGTCSVEGPLTLQTGQVEVTVDVLDEDKALYAMTFFILDPDMDFMDLMASTAAAGPPDWAEMISLHEIDPGTSKTYDMAVHDGPVYGVCWSQLPESAIGNVGPFAVKE